MKGERNGLPQGGEGELVLAQTKINVKKINQTKERNINEYERQRQHHKRHDRALAQTAQ